MEQKSTDSDNENCQETMKKKCSDLLCPANPDFLKSECDGIEMIFLLSKNQGNATN